MLTSPQRLARTMASGSSVVWATTNVTLTADELCRPWKGERCYWRKWPLGFRVKCCHWKKNVPVY